MTKPNAAAPFRRSLSVLHSQRVLDAEKRCADAEKRCADAEKKASGAIKQTPWPKVLSYLCVLFGAGGALLPFVPDHWRVPIIAIAGQLQSYLPPVQPYQRPPAAQQ